MVYHVLAYKYGEKTKKMYFKTPLLKKISVNFKEKFMLMFIHIKMKQVLCTGTNRIHVNHNNF